MTITNYPNGVSSFGIPLMGNGLPATFGNVWFVDYRNGSDENDGKTPDCALKTLSRAYTLCTSNNNDVVLIDGDSTVTETSMITLSKNRVHTIGLTGLPFPSGYGAGAKVNIGVTTDTSDIALIQNTGVRNSFANIKFSSSNTLTQAVYVFAEGGEYTRFFNCEFYKATHLTTTAAAEVLCNGDSSQWYNCWFGDLVNGRGTGGSCVRPNVLFDREKITGKVARDCTFSHCRFNVKAEDSGVAMCHITAANDIERSLVFDNCQFWNAHLAGADPGEAILISAACTQGKVLLINPSTIDCTAHASASAGAYITGGSAPVDNTSGIAAIIDT